LGSICIERHIDGYTPAIQQAKLLASQKSPYYLLFAKETTQDGVYSKFHVEIELPRMDSNYPCLDEEIQEVVEIYVNSATQNLFEKNEKNPSFYAEAEVAGMKEFATRINYFFNCCGGPENITCDAFLSNRKIASDLSNTYIHPASRFVEFTNIENVDVDSYEYLNIDSYLQITFDVRMQDGSFNQEIGGTQNMTQALDELANDNNESNEAIPFDVKVIHVNLSSYLTEIGKLQKSFVKENVTTLPSVSSTLNGEPSAYYEEIVVVDVEPGAPPIILSRVQVEYAIGPEANSAPNDPGRVDDFEGEEVILPIIGAKIAEALLRRAMYASINVGINIVMEVVITKYFGHDDCTWSEALWSANITGWHLAVWAVEGAITGGMESHFVQAIIGAVAQTATYILTTDNFEISTAFINFGQGLLAGAAFGLLSKGAGSAFEKYTKKLANKYGNNSPISKMAIAEFEELLVKFGLNIKIGDDIFEGVQRWYKAWEVVANGPILIRKNANYLQALVDHVQIAKASLIKLKSEFDAVVNKQKWIDDLLLFGGSKLNVSNVALGSDIIRRHGKDLGILGRVNPAGSPGTLQVGLAASQNNIPVKILTTAPNPNYANLHPLDQIQKYWDEINKPFIDDLIAKGDDIRLIHDPDLITNQWNLVSEMADGPFKTACINANLTQVRPYLWFENEYLKSLGYNLDRITGLLKK